MQAVLIKKTIRARPVYHGVAMVNLSLAYPQVLVRENPPAGDKITEYYRLSADRSYLRGTRELYLKAAETYRESRKKGFPFHAYALMSTYQVTYNQKSLLSLYTDFYEYTGGANGTTTRKSETWNLETGRRMELSDFFRGGGYKKIIFDEILAQTSKRMENGESFFRDYRKNIFQYLDEEQYYLTEQGVTVYFQPVTIAPHSSGVVAYLIPYEVFGRDSLFSPAGL